MQPPQAEADPAQIIDFRALRNWLGFARRAGRVRRRVVFGVAGVMFVLAVIAVNVMPKTYRVSCRLLAQKNSALALRGDSSQESTVKSASDLVTRRENVINLIKETKLVSAWNAQKGVLARTKSKVQGLFSPPPTEQQQIDALADYLIEKMKVWSDDTSVTFQIDWRDPQMAYQLVDAAQRGFLEVRHVQEVSSLAEALSILQARAETVRQEVNTSVATLQELRARKQAESKDKPREKPAAKVDEAVEKDKSEPQVAKAPVEAPEVVEKRQKKLAELQVAVESKERMLADLETGRMRRLSDLQAKLQELRSVYTEQHPAITGAKQGIISATQESPQVAPLRDELHKLRAEYDQQRVASGLGASRTGGGGRGRAAVNPGGGLGDVIRIEQESAEERDPEVEYARSELRFAITSYQNLGAEISKTMVDLKTAEAAFKYRYTIVTPPEVPKAPVAPKQVPIVIAALIAGLFIGLIVAVALELRQGVLYASWQVEHGVMLPVIAQVDLPALPNPRS